MNILESLKPLASAITDIMPFVPTIEGASNGTTIDVDGKRYINLCSSNYLSIGNDPKSVAAVKRALDIYGISTNGSPLATGRIRIGVELEEALARFKGTESAILFTSGFAVNAGVLPAILNPLFRYVFPDQAPQGDKVVFIDNEAHASLRHGLSAAGLRGVTFRHNDLNELKEKLEASNVPYKLVVVDGLYSVSGDFAPLPELLKLCEKYNAVLFNDDAHAIGVIGENGRGTAEHFRVEGHPLLLEVGTMSKALGSEGGFLVGEKWFVDYLRPGADSSLFSAALKADNAAAALTALEIIQTEKRHLRVLENAEYFRQRLQQIGFNTGASCAHIVPIWFEKEAEGVIFGEKLLESGFFVQTLKFPVSPRGKACLRVSINYNHDRTLHLDRLIDVLTGLIK
jgi:glycine C-acetyltransferase